MENQKNVGFIDIGTNSIRLALVQITSNGTYTILSEQKETVRLGEGEFTDNTLHPDAISRAVIVCQQFATMARNNNAKEIVVVATSATREAKNKKSFIETLNTVAQLDVKIISGIEEARLIYLGVADGFDMKKDTALMVDIGGGSTELIVANHNEYFHLDSMKLGAIRVTSKFFTESDRDAVSPEIYERLKKYIRDVSIRPLQRVQEFSFDYVIGSSGTIDNLAAVASYLSKSRTFNPGELVTTEEIQAAIQYLCSLPLDQRLDIPGLNPRRADIIIGGAAIIETILEETNSKGCFVTEKTLRDGLLVDYLIRSGYSTFYKKRSVRYKSVYQLARKCNIDEPHATQVQNLSLELFDASKNIGLHQLGAYYRELLAYASILHDIGIFLSYSDHHKHSYYLIQNSDLAGFNQNEIQIMAAIAFFHRKKFPKDSKPQLHGLTNSEKNAVRIISTLIRLSEALDRSHQNVIKKISLTQGPKNLIYLDVFSESNCKLEVWSLSKHRQIFWKVFKKKLVARIFSLDGSLISDTIKPIGE